MATNNNTQSETLYSCRIGVRASLMRLSKAPTAGQLVLMDGLDQCVAIPGEVVTKRSYCFVTGDFYESTLQEYVDGDGFVVGCVSATDPQHIPAAPKLDVLPAIEDLDALDVLLNLDDSNDLTVKAVS